jgi:hypothetical protein
MPWWQDIVKGVSKPIIDDGYIRVPDGPGLGVKLNEEVIKAHLRGPGYFEPTPEYNKVIASGFRTNGPWEHYRSDGTLCVCVDE